LGFHGEFIKTGCHSRHSDGDFKSLMQSFRAQRGADLHLKTLL
jgi:hypothetical protein